MGFGKDSLDSEQFVIEVCNQDSPGDLQLRELVDEIVQREKQALIVEELLMYHPKKSAEYNQVKTAISTRLQSLYEEIDRRPDIRVY
jgi:hypothetical protein